MNVLSASATISIASSRRSARSVRHSFASSTAARRSGLPLRLELVVEALEQRDAVGRRPGEPADRAAIAEPAHLAGAALDDLVAEGDLAVARDHDVVAAPDGEDRRGVDLRGARVGRSTTATPRKLPPYDRGPYPFGFARGWASS